MPPQSPAACCLLTCGPAADGAERPLVAPCVQEVVRRGLKVAVAGIPKVSAPNVEMAAKATAHSQALYCKKVVLGVRTHTSVPRN
jgi:hypothetical protein